MTLRISQLLLASLLASSAFAFTVTSNVAVSPQQQQQQQLLRPFHSNSDAALRMVPPGKSDAVDADVEVSTSTPFASSPSKSASDSSGFSLDSIDVEGLLKNFDISSLTDNAEEIRANVMDGTFGERGEIYVAAQMGLLLCVAIGGIPIVGDLLMLILGPGLLLAGAAVSVIALKDMGGALSPWPVPSDSNDGLVTDGLFAQVRHPIYAGLLAACAGFSIISGSATRLLITAVLIYVLDVKSDFEEDALIQKFPEYTSYQDTVTGKFFPQALLDELPWTNKE